MPELSVQRNRKKTLSYCADLTDDFDIILFLDLATNHSRRHENADAMLAKSHQQRIVLELCDNHRVNASLVKPLV